MCSFANRLTNIKENHKFQKDGKEGQRVEDPAMGIRHIVSEIKDQHSVKYVYLPLSLVFTSCDLGKSQLLNVSFVDTM